MNTFIKFMVLFVLVKNSYHFNSNSIREPNDYHWNLTQWWLENNDDHRSDHSSYVRNRIHFMKNELSNKQKSDFLHEAGEILDPEESGTKTRKYLKPKTTSQSLLNVFSKFFTSSRSHKGNRRRYLQIRNEIKKQFMEYGLEAASQPFWPPELVRFKC